MHIYLVNLSLSLSLSLSLFLSLSFKWNFASFYFDSWRLYTRPTYYNFANLEPMWKSILHWNKYGMIECSNIWKDLIE